MKKLEFVFKNNEDIMIKEECSYEKKDNNVFFDYENMHLKFLFEDDSCTFIRESELDSMSITNDGGKLFGSVKLFEPDLECEIKVNKFSYKITNENINIQYNVETDEGVDKTIILTFLN